MKQAGHKRTNPAWFHVYEVPRVTKSIETESRMVGERGRGPGEREVSVQWGQVPGWEDEEVLGTDGGDGCTTV